MVRAEARLAASTMSSCSMSHWLTGCVCDCSRKMSVPRIDSPNRTYVSLFAKS